MCRTILAAILSWDRAGRIRPFALQDPAAADLLPGMDEDARMASFHLIAPDGSVHSAGAGLTELLRALPGGRVLGAAAAAAQPLTDRAYRLVAGNRDRIGPLIPRSWCRRADAVIARRG
jgi:predicted DCC family thiol-disulfide oxidoreductase YuxK